MKTKLSGKLSHYAKMAASAQQFFQEGDGLSRGGGSEPRPGRSKRLVEACARMDGARARGRAGPDFPPGLAMDASPQEVLIAGLSPWSRGRLSTVVISE
jgi:hypothetical protein